MQMEESNNELIDRFAVSIMGNVTTQTYTGIFELVQLTLSITVRCSEYFYGESCENFCREGCIAASDDDSDAGIGTNTMTIAVTSSILVLLLVVIVVAVSSCIGTARYYKKKVSNVSQSEVVDQVVMSPHVTRRDTQVIFK